MTSPPSHVAPVIVLITVNKNETHALLDAFLGAEQIPLQSTKGGVTYNELGVHGGNRVVHTVCKMGAGGVGAAQQRTAQAITHWQPKAIIAVGIAFGMDETRQAIGDVLVSAQIQDYELGRVNADGTLTLRGDRAGSADNLLNRLDLTDTIEERRGEGWPKVEFGLMLTGQKLLDNLNYRESLITLFPQAIGGEMEGVGLYTSAHAAKVDWLVVKAICDWGHDKNQENKEAWQKQAAKNAARVVKTALAGEGLYDEGLPVRMASVGALLHERQRGGNMLDLSSLSCAYDEALAIARTVSPQALHESSTFDHGAFPWALVRGRDAQGLCAFAPNPWGAAVRVALPIHGKAEQQRRLLTVVPKGMGEFWIDEQTLDLEQNRLRATLTVNGRNRQVFRYIEKGRFTMGSPKDEAGRFENEGPQHNVIIGEGFWLADAACTQGLWQAVMGANPSHFQENKGGGPEHPVECVSWNMIQGFLQSLQVLLPTCRVTLPTEAEWEYACRAGRDGPYSFGAVIGTTQVNFSTGQERDDRGHTVAAKDLPANNWGLHQMHGNVLEWCADPMREYDELMVTDPGLDHALAPKLADGTARVVRGGSWRYHAQGARSAFRGSDTPDRQVNDAGFRLVLRSKLLAS